METAVCAKLCQHTVTSPADDLLSAIHTDIETWMQNADPVDDITILIVEVN